MFRYILIIITLIFSFEVYARERAQPFFDERKWRLSNIPNEELNKSTRPSIHEYILENEDIKNWTELVTVQFFPELKNINAELFEKEFYSTISLQCKKLQWESLHQRDKERMWYFVASECGRHKNQSEISRIIVTEEGLHVFHYANTNTPMDLEIKNKWINILNKFYVVKSDKMNLTSLAGE